MNAIYKIAIVVLSTALACAPQRSHAASIRVVTRAAALLATGKKIRQSPLVCNLELAKPALGYKVTKIVLVKGKNKKLKKKTVLYWQPLTKAEAKQAARLKAVCPASCVPEPGAARFGVAGSFSLSVAENGSVALPSLGESVCGRPLQFVLKTTPLHGSVSGSPISQYSPTTHYTGADNFLARISDGIKTSEAASQINIQVNPGSAEFAGIANSLAPYRSTLTVKEIRSFLHKVAMGDDEDRLLSIGLTQGRAALVDALLSSTFEDQVEADAVNTANNTMTQDLVRDGCSRYVWDERVSTHYWLVHMLRGNGFKEHVALELDDHFATNVRTAWQNSGQCAMSWAPRAHMELIRSNALGSFETILQGMLTDPAMAWWLNNVDNQYADYLNHDTRYTGSAGIHGNQNFARELMELFTVGKYDSVTGARNYQEEDIEPATRAVSGYASRWPVGITLPDPAYPTISWRAGDYVWGVRWYEDLAYLGQISIFQSLPDAATQAEFTPPDFVSYLLYQHPGTSRHIAHSFFSRFVHTQPSEATVSELASDLLASGYDLRSFFRKVLNSSAMFSTNAVGDCIDSPAEQLVYVIRTLRLPISTKGALDVVYNSLAATRHLPMQAADVFDWHLCGDDTLGPGSPNHGETWNQSQLLLARYRAVNDILKYELTPVGQGGEGVVLQNTLFETWNSPTAAQVLARFEELFNYSLSSNERAAVLDYLDRSFDRWNPSDSAKVQTRLAGLAYVFATHPKASMMK